MRLYVGYVALECRSIRDELQIETHTVGERNDLAELRMQGRLSLAGELDTSYHALHILEETREEGEIQYRFGYQPQPLIDHPPLSSVIRTEGAALVAVIDEIDFE